MNEIYKDVVGYEGKYQVSNLGNVKSLNYRQTGKEKVMKQTLIDNGYLQVDLYNNGKHKKYGVHRLVADAFLDNPNNYPQVNHKDENKQNNNVDNLEWATAQYNINYGTHGERAGKTRSKPVIQYDLQGNFIKSWNSATEIEKQLKISRTNICNCCNGKIKTAYGYKWRYAELQEEY